MIDFEATWRPAMHIIGLEVRTTHARETDPATRAIAAVWRRFLAEAIGAGIPHVIDATVLYAVHTRSPGEADSEYSFILGRSVDEHAVSPHGLTKATLPPGSYFAGTSHGDPAEAALRGWQEVGEYFARPGAPARSYTADIEVHRAEYPREVEIYVAVK